MKSQTIDVIPNYANEMVDVATLKLPWGRWEVHSQADEESDTVVLFARRLPWPWKDEE